MIYIFSLIVIIFLIIWYHARNQNLSTACERCGKIEDTISFNGTPETLEYFKGPYYAKPLNLCFQCMTAQHVFLNTLVMLSIERQMGVGRSDQVKKAEEVWGGKAKEMMALLYVARENMEYARRILNEDTFVKVKPWLDEQLVKR